MEFLLGCNYWASNAGTEMWVNWDEAAIDFDLKHLSENGLKCLRVFPNWRDFQPVCSFYGGGNILKEYRHKNGQLFDNPYYLDMEMMRRFERFCEIADKYGMKLIVGLLTGWMSGRTFTPPILEGRNLYLDETALMMEQKFVKGFVSYFENNNAIMSWDLGNECNCFSPAPSREGAASWTAMITNAIRAHDSRKRPVVSGMHSLGIQNEWTIFDQGENVDILTTHPYPFFVEYCYKDDMTSYRTLMHATCEGMYYSDLGGKPCLTEEMGTLGPIMCDDETGSAFLRTNLYSNWANGSLGLLWWCGCEQVELETAPYSWVMMERELGLLDLEGKPKKTLLTYKKFAEWLKEFGRELPKAQTDAVCIVTQGQSQWGAAYMTYSLAKQANINLKFTYSQMQELPESDIYLMPSINGDHVMPKENFDRLMERIYEGATLYISNDAGFLARFEKFAGLHIRNSLKIHDEDVMTLNGAQIEFTREKRHMIEAAGAEVLAYDSVGLPVFTKNIFGKGTVYYLNFPLETMLLEKNYAFHSDCYRVYTEIFKEKTAKMPLTVSNKFVGMTCHYDETGCDVVLINYSGEEQEIGLKMNENYHMTEVYGGNIETLPANEAVIVRCEKN